MVFCHQIVPAASEMRALAVGCFLNIRKDCRNFQFVIYIHIMRNQPFFLTIATASGKIQKYKMREMAVDALNLADAAAIETA